MKKVLGLDFGTNSIGWAIIDDHQIKEEGIRVFTRPETKISKRNELIKLEIRKVKRLSRNQKIILILFITLTTLTIVNYSNWQFWLGLNVTALLTFLTLKK